MSHAPLNPWLSYPLVAATRRQPSVGSLGGHPRGVTAQDWPKCEVCSNPMCHMAQFDAGPALDLGPFVRMSLFICHATGGRCEDWDPWKGANKVLLHSAIDDNLYDGPPTVRVYKRQPVRVIHPTDEQALMRQVQEKRVTMVDALNEIRHDKLGGGAVWLHGDATPRNSSGRPMRLVAQLTTNLVRYDITPNGMAYVFFDDESRSGDARLLWQGS
ncbi:MAG: hypothetical protein EA397_15160 [Deltaproteobacteria bacterium]|nr:MAG: hypothetical protein EA397_15160 [Deltaproteobacteria bacterium]